MVFVLNLWVGNSALVNEFTRVAVLQHRIMRRNGRLYTAPYVKLVPR